MDLYDGVNPAALPPCVHLPLRTRGQTAVIVPLVVLALERGDERVAGGVQGIPSGYAACRREVIV